MNVSNALFNMQANINYASAIKNIFDEYMFYDSVKRYNFIIQFAIKSDNYYFTEERFNRLDKLMHTFKSINEHKALQLTRKSNEELKRYIKKYATEEEKERFLYRERGISRLKGKENYKKFGDLLGIDLLKYASNAKRDIISCRIAMEFWILNDCDKKINNIEELTKTVQGDCNYLYIEKIKKLMKALKIY